jgi:hypothetical protein
MMKASMLPVTGRLHSMIINGRQTMQRAGKVHVMPANQLVSRASLTRRHSLAVAGKSVLSIVFGYATIILIFWAILNFFILIPGLRASFLLQSAGAFLQYLGQV